MKRRPLIIFLPLLLISMNGCSDSSPKQASSPTEPLPVIEHFSADATKLSFLTGEETVRVSWKAKDAGGCILFHPTAKVVDSEGSLQLNVKDGTEVSLECQQGALRSERKTLSFAKLAADAKAIIRFALDQSKLTLSTGDLAQVTLNWQSQNLEHCELIKPFAETLRPTGQKTFSIKESTEFQLECKAQGESFLSPLLKVEVIQNPLPKPVITKFQASPQTLEVEAGNKAMSTLSWESLNATSCLLSSEQGKKELTSKGLILVQLDKTTDFTLLCQNEIATTEAKLRISVNQKQDDPEILRFELEEPTDGQWPGEWTSKMHWESKDADRCRVILYQLTDRMSNIESKELRSTSGSSEIDVLGTTSVSLTCSRGDRHSEIKKQSVTLLGFSQKCAQGEYPAFDGTCPEFPKEETACRSLGQNWDPKSKSCVIEDKGYKLNRSLLNACLHPEAASPSARYTLSLLEQRYAGRTCYHLNGIVQEASHLQLVREQDKPALDLSLLSQRPALTNLWIIDQKDSRDALRAESLAQLKGNKKLAYLSLGKTHVDSLRHLPQEVPLQHFALQNSPSFDIDSLKPFASQLTDLDLSEVSEGSRYQQARHCTRSYQS